MEGSSMGEQCTVLEYKCPSCGATLPFDQEKQKMVCLYCDTEFELEAIKAYNELIKDDKDLKPIENIKMKTVIGEKFDSFIDQVKENKTLTIVTSILGAVTGLLIIYLLYKLIRKFVRWVRR